MTNFIFMQCLLNITENNTIAIQVVSSTIFSKGSFIFKSLLLLHFCMNVVCFICVYSTGKYLHTVMGFPRIICVNWTMCCGVLEKSLKHESVFFFIEAGLHKIGAVKWIWKLPRTNLISTQESVRSRTMI